jgi:hypothetical protein
VKLSFDSYLNGYATLYIPMYEETTIVSAPDAVQCSLLTVPSTHAHLHAQNSDHEFCDFLGRAALCVDRQNIRFLKSRRFHSRQLAFDH